MITLMTLTGSITKTWTKQGLEDMSNFFQAKIDDFNKDTQYFYCRFPFDDTKLFENKVIKQLSRKDITSLCDRGYIYLRKNY